MNKSEKFRELLLKEEYLQNQLSDCVTAQSRMLKKAFKGLGLKLGYIPEVYDDQSVVKVAETTDWSVIYYRNTGVQIETHEISFEDLFDAEAE
jgi:hypothetical protein